MLTRSGAVPWKGSTGGDTAQTDILRSADGGRYYQPPLATLSQPRGCHVTLVRGAERCHVIRWQGLDWLGSFV